MGQMEVRIDFLYLTMDQIKEMAIRDRINKMHGDKMKAAESLQIHFHTIDNVLKAATLPKEETVLKNEQDKAVTDAKKEGWSRDPKTGLNVPSAISPVPGVEKVVGPLVEAEKERIKVAMKEGNGRVVSVLGGTPIKPATKTKKPKGKNGKSKKSSSTKARKIS